MIVRHIHKFWAVMICIIITVHELHAGVAQWQCGCFVSIRLWVRPPSPALCISIHVGVYLDALAHKRKSPHQDNFTRWITHLPKWRFGDDAFFIPQRIGGWCFCLIHAPCTRAHTVFISVPDSAASTKCVTSAVIPSGLVLLESHFEKSVPSSAGWTVCKTKRWCTAWKQVVPIPTKIECICPLMSAVSSLVFSGSMKSTRMM